MRKIGTILSAAAIAALGAMPVELGPLSLGDAAFAQGPPSWAGKGVGAAARGLARGGPPAGIPGVGDRDFGRGGPQAGIPGVGGRDFGRGGPPAGVPGIGGGDFGRGDFGRGGPPAGVPRLGGVPGTGGHFCPPGLADKGCFPPGAQKFLTGFCPRGLSVATADCIPPGLQVFGSGEVIPRDVGFERIFHRDLGLPAPTHGHHYARVDRNVYLVSDGTRQVVRAIGLLTAPGF